MFQSALLYCLSHPVRAAYTFASDPLEVLTAFQERYVAGRERPVPPDLYQPDCGWECRMHELLGVPQPCPVISEFWALWPEVMRPASLTVFHRVLSLRRLNGTAGAVIYGALTIRH